MSWRGQFEVLLVGVAVLAVLAVLVVLPVLLLTLLSLSSETEKPLICPGPPPGLGRCGYGDRSPIVFICGDVVML